MPIEVLLVEDSPGDVRLTREAFQDANPEINLHVASDGVEAMAFLRRSGKHRDAPMPDLILLDLNLPKMDGREVLLQIKEDERLKVIPTVILTTSESETDIAKSYQLQANCYLSKPVQLDAFEDVVKSINDFWLAKAGDEPHVAAARAASQPPLSPVDTAAAAGDAIIKAPAPAGAVRATPAARDKTAKAPAMGRLLQVLLVEDSPGDVRLTRQAFHDANPAINVQVAADGVEAMAILRKEGAHRKDPRPDLVLLDLNLPKMDGRAVLALIKGDQSLKTIPTVVLTTSEDEHDVAKSYQLQANCYLTKPVQLEAFERLVGSISDFWLKQAKLPLHRQRA